MDFCSLQKTDNAHTPTHIHKEERKLKTTIIIIIIVIIPIVYQLKFYWIRTKHLSISFTNIK